MRIQHNFAIKAKFVNKFKREYAKGRARTDEKRAICMIVLRQRGGWLVGWRTTAHRTRRMRGLYLICDIYTYIKIYKIINVSHKISANHQKRLQILQ